MLKTYYIVKLLTYFRGLLDVKKPVAHYWPEFAKQGKARITVEQAMSHSVRETFLNLNFNIFKS